MALGLIIVNMAQCQVKCETPKIQYTLTPSSRGIKTNHIGFKFIDANGIDNNQAIVYVDDKSNSISKMGNE